MSSFNAFATWDPKKSKNTDEITSRLLGAAKPLPRSVLEYQQAKAREVLSCCIPPNAPINSKKVGLVVGKVQSGKTTSFTYLSSLAADNGYKVIIHLLGTTKNLKRDNADKVNEILGTSNKLNHWISKEFTGDSFKADFSSKTMENTLYQRSQEMSFLGEKPEKVLYLYLIKNHSIINHLREYLNDFHNNLEDNHSPLPILIIDDEVDSFSPDVGDDGDESSTHLNLQYLYDACPIVTYVGYTATAAAIANADPSNILNPDFLCTLEPGDDYDGNKSLFGDKLYRLFPDVDNPLQIKTIPEYISEEKLTDVETRNQSLFLALRYWLVGSVIAALRGKLCGDDDPEDANCSTFMIHPSLIQDEHTEMENTVHDAITEIRDALYEGGQFVDDLFEEIYKELFNPDIDSIEYSDVINHIGSIINGTSIGIRVLNADEREGRVSIPNIDYSHHNFWIVIGGQGLSRGYVVKGLLTTWMSRLADEITADTLEQTGRFFGYHKGYKDLIRIFLRFRAIEAFKAYQFYESSLLVAVENCIEDGVRLADKPFDLYYPPEFQHDTTPAKSKRDAFYRRFKWAQSQYSCIRPIDIHDVKPPEKNIEMYKILNTFINNLNENGSLSVITPDQYSGWYEDSTKLRTPPEDVFRSSSNIPLDTIKELLFDPLLEIMNLDKNLKFLIQFIYTNSKEDDKFDVIEINHPGVGGNPSRRGIFLDLESESNESDAYKIVDIQQGPSTSSAGFVGDGEVTINEANHTIQIAKYDGVHFDGVDLGEFGPLITISIARPGLVSTQIKAL